MDKKIPTYKIIVNPDDETTGVYAVSLVDEPAIEVDWIKLSKQIESFEFSADQEKQMLFGPLLIPNKLIFRRDEKGNEYNIYFDEETIQIIADKYNESKLGDVFNFQHSNKKVEAILLQNWITGKLDKSQEYGFELPAGSWFGGVKIKDKNFWMEEVKTEKVKGFSVEIKAGTELVQLQIEYPNLNVFGYITKYFQLCPGAVKTFTELVQTTPDENTVGMIRSAAVVADAIFDVEDDVMEYGIATPEQLNEVVVLVQDYKDIISEIGKALATTYNVDYMDGHIENVKQYTTEVDKNKINLMEYKTRDGMTLTWDGNAEVGKDIFIVLEDGTKAPLADGEYELEDGTKIVAQGGKVAEIMAPEAPATEGLQEPTTDVLEQVKPMIEELRGIIAELTTRIDKLENVETVVEESNDSENYSKIKELEEKVESLSKIAGATTITKKNDREIEFEKREAVLIDKINFLRKMNK